MDDHRTFQRLGSLVSRLPCVLNEANAASTEFTPSEYNASSAEYNANAGEYNGPLNLDLSGMGN
jgi:hypothetical protein